MSLGGGGGVSAEAGNASQSRATHDRLMFDMAVEHVPPRGVFEKHHHKMCGLHLLGHKSLTQWYW